MEALKNIYYNKDTKLRFIKEKEKSPSVAINFIDNNFRKSAKTEKALGKDLCDWTMYEIVEYYKLMNISSYESLLNINSLFSNYTQFCLDNNLVKDNQNHYLECTRKILFGCLNKVIFENKIVNRETVLGWVNQLPNPRDQFVLLSLFEYGKSKMYKDIVNARPENVVGDTLILENRTVKISQELKDIINNCITEDVYYSMTGNGSLKMPLVDHGYIIKSYPNQNINSGDHQKGRNIYILCQRIFNYLGVEKWMSSSALSTSGQIHMIKEQSKKYNMNPWQYILSDNISEVENQFGVIFKKSLFLQKFGNYLDA